MKLLESTHTTVSLILQDELFPKNSDWIISIMGVVMALDS